MSEKALLWVFLAGNLVIGTGVIAEALGAGPRCGDRPAEAIVITPESTTNV